MTAPMLVAVISLIVLVALMFGGMWIGMAMAVSGFFGLAYLRGFGTAYGLLRSTVYHGVADYVLSAIPLFILMGLLIGYTGIGEKLYSTAHKWVGQMRGGLASASTVACAVLGATTGSSSVGTVLMAKIALPEMRKYKYSDELAGGAIATGGTIGILIPPSIGFILYGLMTEQSIGKLFMAGILPGILLTVLFIGAIWIVTKRQPGAGPPGPKTSFKEKVFSLRQVWHIVVIFLIILGGIYLGIFTPTEAGAIGVVATIVVTAINRTLTWKAIKTSLIETAALSAMIFFLIIGAKMFVKLIGVSGFSGGLANFVVTLPVSRSVTFAGIIVLYLFVGMIMDIYAAVLLTVPALYPSVVALGYDPIWFGVVVVLVLQMGLVTPPVGMNAYVLAGMSDIPLTKIFRGIVPFVVAIVVCIAILMLAPQIALFVPGTM